MNMEQNLFAIYLNLFFHFVSIKIIQHSNIQLSYIQQHKKYTMELIWFLFDFGALSFIDFIVRIINIYIFKSGLIDG